MTEAYKKKSYFLSTDHTEILGHVFWKVCLDAAHTCDKFQKGIREIFLSFQGGLSKMYRIYRKILIQLREILKFWKNWFFRRNFGAHFREPP